MLLRMSVSPTGCRHSDIVLWLIVAWFNLQQRLDSTSFVLWLTQPHKVSTGKFCRIFWERNTANFMCFPYDFNERSCSSCSSQGRFFSSLSMTIWIQQIFSLPFFHVFHRMSVYSLDVKKKNL